MRRLIVAAVSAAALLAPAASAQGSTVEQDICVMGPHWMGEVCTSQVPPYAQAVVACMAAGGTDCVRLPSPPSASRMCIAGSLVGRCLETIICAAPHDVAVKLGIDGYVDPQVNCID